MRQETQKIKVKEYFLSNLQTSSEDGEVTNWDFSDDGREEKEYYARFATQNIMNTLMPKQRRVVICLQQGMDRRQIAVHLLISLQEVHQIVLRIKKRIREQTSYGETKLSTNSVFLEDIVWVYHTCARATPTLLYKAWGQDVILKSYQRPSIRVLEKLIASCQAQQDVSYG